MNPTKIEILLKTMRNLRVYTPFGTGTVRSVHTKDGFVMIQHDPGVMFKVEMGPIIATFEGDGKMQSRVNIRDISTEKP